MFYTLLVDTNESFRQALADVLVVYFPLIDVEHTSDAIEALSKVECMRPNIIFMDIQLPGGTGIEMLKKIRQMCEDIVIVILTSSNQPENRQLVFENGANHYISKIEDSYMEEILTVIEEVLDSRKASPE